MVELLKYRRNTVHGNLNAIEAIRRVDPGEHIPFDDRAVELSDQPPRNRLNGKVLRILFQSEYSGPRLNVGNRINVFSAHSADSHLTYFTR